MAECPGCNQEMTNNRVMTCDIKTLVYFEDGAIRHRKPYTPEGEVRPCRDCNVQPGGYHHLNCCIEVCPKCGGQVISCGCYKPGRDLEQWRVTETGRMIHTPPVYGESAQEAKGQPLPGKIRVGDMTVNISVEPKPFSKLDAKGVAHIREVWSQWALTPDNGLNAYSVEEFSTMVWLAHHVSDLFLHIDGLQEENKNFRMTNFALRQNWNAADQARIKAIKSERVAQDTIANLEGKLATVRHNLAGCLDGRKEAESVIAKQEKELEDCLHANKNLSADLGGVQEELDRANNEVRNWAKGARDQAANQYALTLENGRQADEIKITGSYVHVLEKQRAELALAVQLSKAPILSARDLDLCAQGLEALRERIEVYQVAYTNEELDEAREGLDRLDDALQAPRAGLQEPSIFDLRQRLANYAHVAWAGWMKYQFSKGVMSLDEVIIQGTPTVFHLPKWAFERWTRQKDTAYSSLPDEEKKSDLAEADKMIAIMQGWLLVEAGNVPGLSIPDPLPTTQDQWLAAYNEMRNSAITYRNSLNLFTIAANPIPKETLHRLHELAVSCMSCISYVHHRKTWEAADNEHLLMSGELLRLVEELGGRK